MKDVKQPLFKLLISIFIQMYGSVPPAYARNISFGELAEP